MLDEIRGISTNPDDYLEESYEEDPYIPHERIFSKYSMMLYYSQDAGKNYYIHQDCRYCESCHEKVAIVTIVSSSAARLVTRASVIVRRSPAPTKSWEKVQ